MKLNFLSKKPDLLLSKFLNRNSEAGLKHDFLYFWKVPTSLVLQTKKVIRNYRAWFSNNCLVNTQKSRQLFRQLGEIWMILVWTLIKDFSLLSKWNDFRTFYDCIIKKLFQLINLQSWLILNSAWIIYSSNCRWWRMRICS